jgi:hypothetical protein
VRDLQLPVRMLLIGEQKQTNYAQNGNTVSSNVA